MIPFKNRFHGHGSLNYVYKNGQTIRSDTISVRFIQNPRRKNHRLAVVVGKKILKSAVGRNRIRRRVYEYVHTIIPNFKNTYDIVFVVHSKDFKNIPHKELTTQINQLLTKAGIL